MGLAAVELGLEHLAAAQVCHRDVIEVGDVVVRRGQASAVAGVLTAKLQDQIAAQKNLQRTDAGRDGNLRYDLRDVTHAPAFPDRTGIAGASAAGSPHLAQLLQTVLLTVDLAGVG